MRAPSAGGSGAITVLHELPHPVQAGDLLALLDALPAWRVFLDAHDRVVSSWRAEGLVARLPGGHPLSLEELIPQPMAGRLLEAARLCRSANESITVAGGPGPPDGIHTYEARVVPLAEGRVGILGMEAVPDPTFLEELRKSEERFRLAFKTSPDSIAINRASDGKYVAINEGFTELLGWQEHEVLGRTSLELGIWALPQERAALMADLGRSGRSRIEGTFRRKNGNIGVGLLSAALFELGGAPHILSVTRDVTAEREAERERRRLEQALRQSQKLESVGVLASGVAHEFRNLLHTVRVYVDLLGQGAPPESAARPHLLQLERAVERGADLTSRLLAFGRKAEVRVQRIDLNDVVNGVARLLERTLPAAIHLDLRLSAEPLIVDGDPGQLEQVLLNLAVNARDAMPQGGELEFSSSGWRPGGRACRRPSRSGGATSPSFAFATAGTAWTRRRFRGSSTRSSRPRPPDRGRASAFPWPTASSTRTAAGSSVRALPGWDPRSPCCCPSRARLPAAAAPPWWSLPPGRRWRDGPRRRRRARDPAGAGHAPVRARLPLPHGLERRGGARRVPGAGRGPRRGGHGSRPAGLGGEACLREIRRSNRRARVIISSGSAWAGWREAGATAFLTKPYPLSELLSTLRRALVEAGPE